jgi:hypothetical protein
LIVSVRHMPRCLEVIPSYEHWREDGLKLSFTETPENFQNKRIQPHDPVRVSESVESYPSVREFRLIII